MFLAGPASSVGVEHLPVPRETNGRRGASDGTTDTRWTSPSSVEPPQDVADEKRRRRTADHAWPRRQQAGGVRTLHGPRPPRGPAPAERPRSTDRHPPRPQGSMRRYRNRSGGRQAPRPAAKGSPAQPGAPAKPNPPRPSPRSSPRPSPAAGNGRGSLTPPLAQIPTHASTWNMTCSRARDSAELPTRMISTPLLERRVRSVADCEMPDAALATRFASDATTPEARMRDPRHGSAHARPSARQRARAPRPCVPSQPRRFPRTRGATTSQPRADIRDLRCRPWHGPRGHAPPALHPQQDVLLTARRPRASAKADPAVAACALSQRNAADCEVPCTAHATRFVSDASHPETAPHARPSAPRWHASRAPNCAPTLPRSGDLRSAPCSRAPSHQPSAIGFASGVRRPRRKLRGETATRYQPGPGAVNTPLRHGRKTRPARPIEAPHWALPSSHPHVRKARARCVVA
jgi:hypothetical protein